MPPGSLLNGHVFMFNLVRSCCSFDLVGFFVSFFSVHIVKEVGWYST